MYHGNTVILYYLFNGITMLFYTMRICVYTMVIMFLYYHGNTMIFFLHVQW